jgi:lipid II:glycine glycyltransferase (peptidoglycan interpeptide bridge formation enzyme)
MVNFSISEIVEKEEWLNYFSQIKLVNLSQDWDYGKFRENTSNVKVVRYKILENGKVVGIFQCYIKLFPIISFLKVIYINRGPLLLEEFPINKYINLLKELKRHFSILNGIILILSPFRELNLELESELKNLKFIQFFTKSYFTSYLDLTKSEELLRKELQPKWRNQLNSAEKKSMRIVTDYNGLYDDFILEAYKQMSSEKEFDTLNNYQIKLLFKGYRETNNLVILLALNQFDEPIAFKVFIGYNNSIMYLMGWVSVEGRSDNAPKLLMWNAIKHFKSLGLVMFDLGGMDPINLPGIAKFKQGLGGRTAEFIERLVFII